MLVVDGSGFGTNADEEYFRLVYFGDEAVLNQAFDEIASVVKSNPFPGTTVTLRPSIASQNVEQTAWPVHERLDTLKLNLSSTNRHTRRSVVR